MAAAVAAVAAVAVVSVVVAKKINISHKWRFNGVSLSRLLWFATFDHLIFIENCPLYVCVRVYVLGE